AAGFDTQPLKHTVEVVNDTGVVAVDEYLRLAGLGVDSQRRGKFTDAIAICRIPERAPGPPLVPRVVSPMWGVGVTADDDDGRRPAIAALRLGRGGRQGNEQHRRSQGAENEQSITLGSHDNTPDRHRGECKASASRTHRGPVIRSTRATSVRDE